MTGRTARLNQVSNHGDPVKREAAIRDRRRDFDGPQGISELRSEAMEIDGTVKREIEV